MFHNDNIKFLQSKLFVRIFTYPLSILYTFIVHVRNYLYKIGCIKSYSLPGTCISVGNLAAGGTGKTPIIIELTSILLKKSKTPVILSRGYKSGISAKSIALIKDGRIIQTKNILGKVVPDEALMLSKRLPQVDIIVSPDRYQAALWYLNNHNKKKVTHWLLDDGYQHLKIKRDLNIVLIDASSSTQENVLPYGLLRESYKNLNRADSILFTRCRTNDNVDSLKNRIKEIKKLSFYKVQFINDWPVHISSKQVIQHKHMPALLICGIAQPLALKENLENIGIEIKQCIALSDHQEITWEHINKKTSGYQSLITTEKDYWRNPIVFKQCNLPVYISRLKLKTDLQPLLRQHYIITN